MKSKFLSLMLLVVMFASLIPVTGAYAAGGATYTVDDFESYDVGVYSNAQSPLMVDGVKKWTINSSVKVEVFETIGIDGKATKALKYINQAGGDSSISENIYRLVAQRSPENSLSTTELSGHVWVQETDIFLPENVTLSDGSIDVKRPYKATIGYGAGVEGEYLYVYAKNTGKKIESGKWYNIKTAFDFTDYADDNKNLKYTVYVDDEPVAHGTTSSSKAGSAYLGYYIIGSSKRVSTTTDAVGGFNDIYFAFDNLHAYTDPDTVVASSDFEGLNTVAVNTEPTVDFDDTILVLPTADGSTLSAANIEMTKSNGEVFEVASVSASEDYKSITIVPEADFDKGETYTVKVTGIIDRYGRVIEDYTFSFTTAEDNLIEVKEAPKFVKQYLFQPGNNAEEINALENGYISVTHNVRNNSVSKVQDVILMCVLKENAEIKYFQFKNDTLSPGAELTFNGGFKIDNAAEQSIELYVWDTMSGMTPLAEKYVINKDGITPSISE